MNNDLYKSIKKMVNYYSVSITNDLINPVNALQPIIKQIQVNNDHLNKALKSVLNLVTEQTKAVAKEILALGFYPINKVSLVEEEFLKINNKNKQTDYICNEIKKNITSDFIKEISDYFDKPKIMEIYKDYDDEKFDNAILKTIVTVNNIFNTNYDGISGEDFHLIRERHNNELLGLDSSNQKALRNSKNNKNDKKYELQKYDFYIIAPYYYADKKENPLYKTYMYGEKFLKDIKKEYRKIPYNRNAIIHGHVDDYGTEENCLRWFSVLINTYELFKLLEELKPNE